MSYVVCLKFFVRREEGGLVILSVVTFFSVFKEEVVNDISKELLATPLRLFIVSLPWTFIPINEVQSQSKTA